VFACTPIPIANLFAISKVHDVSEKVLNETCLFLRDVSAKTQESACPDRFFHSCAARVRVNLLAIAHDARKRVGILLKPVHRYSARVPARGLAVGENIHQCCLQAQCSIFAPKPVVVLSLISSCMCE
jgi:hypothetical protein